MKLYLAASAVLAAGAVNTAAVARRAVSDADILNYALTLEHLEDTFYREGLKNYTHEDFVDAGFADPFYSNIQKVAADEKAHVDFLTQALSDAGAKPAEECTYAFPATDVKSFVALANILEGVGVSAYLGAAASIMDKTYLTAAGSVLTVEARHSAYLRGALKESPFPQSFDAPLDLNEVYTVASPFIASCPSSNPKLPVKAFPSLEVSPMGPVMENSTITLTPGEDFKMGDGPVKAAFVTVTGPVFAPLKQSDSGYSLSVPPGIAGQSYVVLTSSGSNVTDDNVLAGPGIVEVGAPSGSMTSTQTSMMSPSMSTSMMSPSMSASMSPSMSSSSPTGTMSAPPQFTGAAQGTRGSIEGVVGAMLAVIMLL